MIPQVYPLYAMVAVEDRWDLNPGSEGFDGAATVGPADVCMVVGWEIDGDPASATPIFAQIEEHFPNGASPIWPTTDDCHYELRLTLPTEADRKYFAQRIAAYNLAYSLSKEAER